MGTFVALKKGIHVSDKDYFLATYKQAAGRVTGEISLVAKYLAGTFVADDPLCQEVKRFVTEGGKRFRPALSLITANSLGHDELFPHLALETFHKYLLAHDDVFDRDSLRYGAPTIHAKMGELCPIDTDHVHFGNSLATIAGTLMNAATNRIILSSALSDSIKIDLSKLMVQATEDVTWGWYDQFIMDYLPLDSDKLSFERIEKSIIWVTGKYSIKLPLYYGYLMAGVKIPDGLEELADTMGLLFQTGDDVIGLFGNPEDTGKSNYGDIVQGKKTLPMWLSYTLANDKDKETLNRCVGKANVTAEEIKEVRAIVKRSGGLQQTEKLMHDYHTKCLQQLEVLELHDDLRRFLRGFVQYLEIRDR